MHAVSAPPPTKRGHAATYWTVTLAAIRTFCGLLT